MARSSDIRSAWDLPAATSIGKAHDEWLIDESIAETFPASDATSPVRPGSLVGSRYAGVRTDQLWQEGQRVIDIAAPWLAAIGLTALLWLVLKRRDPH